MYAYFIYVYVTELCQQLYIYNEEVQCRSHTSCAQVLQLPQSSCHKANLVITVRAHCFQWLHMCYAQYIYIYIYI